MFIVSVCPSTIHSHLIRYTLIYGDMFILYDIYIHICGWINLAFFKHIHFMYNKRTQYKRHRRRRRRRDRKLNKLYFYIEIKPSRINLPCALKMYIRGQHLNLHEHTHTLANHIMYFICI